MHHKSHIDLGSRNDRRILEHEHDPYARDRKRPGAVVCRDCGAVYIEGRWHWVKQVPVGAVTSLCSACRRIADDYPAGIITLSGAYVSEHIDQLLQIANNCEKEEKSTHPTHRIMSVERQPESLVVKTTDIHLPHRIVEAIHNACHGEHRTAYDKGGHLVRISWWREK